jgi:hypothetical protein
MSDEIDKIAIFRNKEIRKQLYAGEWWFSVADIISVLTESKDAGAYWRKLKERLIKEGSNQTVTNCHSLKMTASDGKQRLTDAMNTEDLFRLIQSIPSPKIEPFKRWLAKVGYERVQEIENPELAQKRIRATYLAKGYEPDWIEKRMQGIETRAALTDEWHDRGVKGEQNYAILTSEISKAAFGITPSDHKKLKGIKNHNLRDHMSRMELIFTELGEAATTEIAKTDDVYGMHGNKDAAHRGGSVAGTAREQLEKETGKKVITEQNFLPKSNDKKIK